MIRIIEAVWIICTFSNNVFYKIILPLSIISDLTKNLFISTTSNNGTSFLLDVLLHRFRYSKLQFLNEVFSVIF
jgi:hypothetical protein